MSSYQISLICVLVVATMSSAHIGGRIQDSELVKVYCGRTLAIALADICYNVDDSNLLKRSDVGMYSGILSLPEKEHDMHMTWPWMVPYKARGLSGPRQRGKRQQVVNECCEKACSIDELLTYCG